MERTTTKNAKRARRNSKVEAVKDCSNSARSNRIESKQEATKDCSNCSHSARTSKRSSKAEASTGYTTKRNSTRKSR